MAANAGRNQRSFIDMHEELTTTLQLKLMEYVKLLDPVDNGTGNAPAGTRPSGTHSLPNGEVAGTKSAVRGKDRHLETEDGWPVMPEVSENELKDGLEDLLRKYLTAQYSESGPKMPGVPQFTMCNRTCLGKTERTTTLQ
jgi:hypothetical protein